ncbi:MAG: hypothetical protein ACI8PZ_005867 [Myxococcota bacterium]|jgi:hypothetical protein
MLLLLTTMALAGSAIGDAFKAFDGLSVEDVYDRMAVRSAFAPDDVEAWWTLGWACYAQHDFEGALSAWGEVRRLDPERRGLAFWAEIAAVRTRWSPGPVGNPPVSARPSGPAALTVAAGGDTMLGNSLAGRTAPGNGEALLAAAAPMLRAADLAFVNVESAIADDLPSTKCGPTSTSCYAFRTPTRYTAALVDAGVDVVSHANNHAMDLGELGILSTAAALDAAGIAHSGRYGDVASVQAAGLTVAVVAAHSGECCLNVNDLNEVVAAIREADATADLVVFSFHGGAEGSRARRVPGRVEVAWGERRGDVRLLARTAVEAGADLVLGHGPHVLRAMEVWQGRLIAYSLGNLVGYRQFGTKGGFTGTSGILEVQLAPNGVVLGGRVLPLVLDEEAVPQPDPTGRAWAQLTELAGLDFPTTGVTFAADGALVLP